MYFIILTCPKPAACNYNFITLLKTLFIYNCIPKCIRACIPKGTPTSLQTTLAISSSSLRCRWVVLHDPQSLKWQCVFVLKFCRDHEIFSNVKVTPNYNEIQYKTSYDDVVR